MRFRFIDGKGSILLDENIENFPTVIGRQAPADLIVPHPQISSRHAELTFVSGALQIRDLASTNGTFLLGQRINQISLPIPSVVQLGSEVMLEISVPTENVLGESTAVSPFAPEPGLGVIPPGASPAPPSTPLSARDAVLWNIIDRMNLRALLISIPVFAGFCFLISFLVLSIGIADALTQLGAVALAVLAGIFVAGLLALPGKLFKHRWYFTPLLFASLGSVYLFILREEYLIYIEFHPALGIPAKLLLFAGTATLGFFGWYIWTWSLLPRKWESKALSLALAFTALLSVSLYRYDVFRSKQDFYREIFEQKSLPSSPLFGGPSVDPEKFTHDILGTLPGK